MLDLIEEGAFVAAGSGRLQPVSKTAVFREFMAPLDLEEEIAAHDPEVAGPEAVLLCPDCTAAGTRTVLHDSGTSAT